MTNLSGLTNFIDTNFPSVYSHQPTTFGTMTAPTNVLDFAIKSGISEQDFITIEPFLMSTTNTVGLINVNTANAAALGCIPGIG